ncbi:hypothetical protein M0R45_030626 [Rubus argutus]|uniref:Uncharacterized protein n=1 Tax=Rubus argutus TaxID=59490 RepID=A0AAW1WE35_RUBAR
MDAGYGLVVIPVSSEHGWCSVKWVVDRRWCRGRAAMSLKLLAVGVVERERNRSGGDDAGLGVAGLLDMVDEGDGKEDSGALGKMQRRRGINDDGGGPGRGLVRCSPLERRWVERERERKKGREALEMRDRLR